MKIKNSYNVYNVMSNIFLHYNFRLYNFITVFFISFNCYTQTLNLPPRQSNALTGSQFVSLVTNYTLTNREDEIWLQITSGNIPAFQRNLIPVTTTAIISSTNYTVVYYTIPDYLAIGCDTNYFLCPMTPLLAQRIADFCGCIMPTRKMANQIWTAATVKLAPSTIPPSGQMTTIPVMNQHNTTVWGQRSAVLGTHPLGELVGGNKKDVIISNSIYGNPSPGRVVIYGWHQLNGSPIQPLYSGHEETYADYSHGIRLIQNAITVNGSANTVTGILQSSTLYSLLSDEGVISVPHYPTSATIPTVSTPTVFALQSESNSSIRLIIQNDPNTSQYKIQLSNDGLNFSNTQYLSVSNTIITGLQSNHLYFVRIAAVGIADTSSYSEILGAVTSLCTPQTIIVSGFDRAYTGNTYNFIRQHGIAFYNNSTAFNSATNGAITSGLVNLTNYKIADYILGNESTTNETFSTMEQTKVKTFLEGGGNLFVSGAEIAWDLDHSGSTGDKDFYNNYLKAIYVDDAPNGQANTFYQCQATVGNIFEGIENINYDNGTHGTYNVSYPDVIAGANGGVSCFAYIGVASSYGGITYNGLFPNGTQPGKLVNLGFPFEAIYPDSTRLHVMKKILDFFNVPNNVNMPFVNSPVIYCQNDSATALTAIGQNILWYNDSTGSIGNSIAPIPSLNTAGSFIFYVSQTISGCESNRNQITVITKPQPEAPVLEQIGDTIFSNIASENHWFLNSNLIDGENNNFLSPDTSGNFTATAIMDGCESTTSNTIIVIISDYSSQGFFNRKICTLFPNPLTDLSVISLQDLNDEIIEINIFDVSGNLIIKRKNIFLHTYTVYKIMFKSGIYFYKIYTKKESVLSGKIIVTD